MLAPFFAAASEAREVPLDDALARRLTDQALAAMQVTDVPEPAPAPLSARRRRILSPERGCFDWLLAPPGLVGAAAVAGIAGLAVGFWVPEMGALAGGALGWTGLPLAGPELPWAEDAGLLALIDG